jgi:L,D-peptidoglycan transpeptidase YkuD (ErfK/YbiS/YcfS/YnhG family)
MKASFGRTAAGGRSARRRLTVFMITLAFGLAVTLAGCMQARELPAALTEVPAPGAGSAAEPESEAELGPAKAVSKRLPGLGPKTFGKIPAGSKQVLVVTGAGKNSSRSRATFYQRTGRTWKAVSSTWTARNGHRGWSANHRLGDLRSPIGVFSITDAGGKLPDVGSRLPYSQDPLFTVSGIGIAGEPLDGAFDYVIAINYNRRIGRSPIDKVRPQGQAKGGGIWLHIDPGGPTQGCVSLSKRHLRSLLKTFDPAKKPVIVMGDAASLRA